MRKIVIDADKKQSGHAIGELFTYRDLFFLLAYKDFKIRYAQTFLGLAWAVIQPLLTLIILTLIFGRLARIDTEQIPYPLFAICGISIWSYFSFVLSQSASAIIASQEMIKKVYFPRLILPLSKTATGIVDLLVGLLFILALMLYYAKVPTANLLFLPLFIMFGILGSLGLGIWISALSLRYRDFQHMVPFLVQFGLYISPIAYPSIELLDKVPGVFEWVYFLNPISGVVEGIRWSILDTTFPWKLSLLSFGTSALVFFTGIRFFMKVETVMSDII